MSRHLFESLLDALTPVKSFIIPAGRGCPYATACPFKTKHCPTEASPIDREFTCVNGTQPRLEDMPLSTQPRRRAEYAGSMFGMELALPH